MERAVIHILVKKKNKRSKNVTIDVQYDKGIAEIKLPEIGDVIQSVNQSASVTVEYHVFSDISKTWMNMMSYYASEKRIVNH